MSRCTGSWLNCSSPASRSFHALPRCVWRANIAGIIVFPAAETILAFAGGSTVPRGPSSEMVSPSRTRIASSIGVSETPSITVAPSMTVIPEVCSESWACWQDASTRKIVGINIKQQFLSFTGSPFTERQVRFCFLFLVILLLRNTQDGSAGKPPRGYPPPDRHRWGRTT